MAPLLKNAPEVGSSLPPQPPSQLRADHLGADAVSLDVPVKVHGSRVTEIVRGTTPHTEPFEEQTSTMIVFPQGGVLRMSTQVSVNQMLVVTNLKSNQDAICRVVKVRTYSNLAGYVEIEFTHSHPGYWGVEFASDDAPVPTKAGSPEPQVNALSGKTPGAAILPNQAKTPSAPPAASTSNNHETSFISIGSQEEVQPSASITRVSKLSVVRKEAPSPVQERLSVPEITPARVPQPQAIAPAIANNSSSSETVAEGIETSPAAASRPAENSNLVAADALAPAKTSFGTGFASGTDEYVEGEKKPSFNWKIVAAGAALAVVLGGGGFFLMHSGTAQDVPPKSASVSTPAAQIDSTTSAAPASQSPATQVVPPATVANRAPVQRPAPSVTSTESRPSKSSAPADDVRSAQTETSKPETAAKPGAKYIPNVTSDLFGTLNAHPVAGSQHAAAQAYAPAPEAGTAASNDASTLPGVSNSIALAAPPVEPGQPIQVKREVVQPRLLNSVLPVYPAAARALHAQGDVVVQVVINENGTVTDAKPISGPIVLRQAAINAVRQWKYDPSKINGKAAAAQIFVTLRFNL